MTDATRKRREQRAGYEAALANWRALDAPKPCPDCDDAGTVHIPGYGALPCPYCRPDEAARAATP